MNRAPYLTETQYQMELASFPWPTRLILGTPAWWPLLDALHRLREAQLIYDPKFKLWNHFAPREYQRTENAS